MKKIAAQLTALFLLLLLVVACGRTEPTPPSEDAATSEAWRADVEKYRRDLETKLTSDTGWLTIAGLSFLTKPATTFGSDASNDVVLPVTTPSRVGAFLLDKDGRISVRLEPGIKVSLLDGKPLTGGPIRTDAQGPPDRLVLGDVQVWVHMSGARPAIRIRDKQNALRQTFTGMKWYPVDPSYRIEATFEPFDAPRALQVPNLLGDVDTMMTTGHAVFTLNGTEHRMLAVADDEELWFIFRDGTSGETTYPAARFLYTPLPQGGKVVLDFNRAESPPCAFNPYATCPLPPPDNRLKVRVEAGEKYEKH